MAGSINLIAFGTFGNPNGFKQTFFVGNKELAKSIKTFDLNTNAIKLFINAKVYAIRKEYVNGFNTIAYSIYTYAREQNSDRSGTFIGSSILFTDRIAQEHITIAKLNEFHDQLVSKNVVKDIISVNHSDKFSVVKPKDFDKIEFHLREIENLNFTQNTENNLVVFCNVNDNNLKQFFEKSIDLLNVYDTIYFTDSKEVAEFVHQKRVFKLIQNVGEKRDFETELNTLIRERKREQTKFQRNSGEKTKKIQVVEQKNGLEKRDEREKVEKKEYKIDKYKLATLILAISLIFTWVYFLFFKSNSENQTEMIQNQGQVNTIKNDQKPAEISKIEKLNPISNSTLNENDYRMIAKNIKPNMKLDEVIKVIFNKNLTEIKNFYSGQESIYSKHLLELNKQCFEEKEGIYYFTKDTLRQIPSFKK